MVGSLLAGSEEAPGEIELFQGRTYKSYRGMGSLGAMQQLYGSRDRYFQQNSVDDRKLVPEGIEGRVPYKGPVSPIVEQLVGGLRSAMGYTGCKDIYELRAKGEFIPVVHDVSVTKEAPNYPGT